MGSVGATLQPQDRRAAACVKAVTLCTAALLAAAAAGAAPTWQAPARLSPSPRALGPDIALNAAGSGAVVWDHEDGADCPTQPASLSCIHIVEAVPRTAGAATWQAPIEVARPGIGAAPKVAIDAAGNIAIIWIHDIGQPRVLQATIRPVGATTWPNANDLSGTPLQIKNHAVGLDASGNAVAVWAQRDGNTFYVVGDLRPASGGVWLAPVALSSVAADASAGPALAVVPSGEALVAWIDSSALRVARGSATSGVWDPPLTPAAGGVNADTDVDIALNPAGDAIAVWSWRRSQTGANFVQAAFQPAGGNWEAAADVGVASAGPSRVHAAIDDAGGATVVWRDGNSLKGSGRSRTSGNWSAPKTIAINVAESGAALATNGFGNAVAVWPNTVTGAIRGAIRPAGGAWQPPTAVSARDSSVPVVAIDPASRAVAVWNRMNGQAVLVESADLAPAGPVLANVTVPPTARVGVRASFSVSPKRWAAPLFGPPTWRFGDGKTATGPHVTHTYASAGMRTATVTQRDTSGARSIATRKVVVRNT
jgi:PKD domain